MKCEYHWLLKEHIPSERLPIYVEFTPRGEHPALWFHDHESSEIAIVARGSAVHLIREGGLHHSRRRAESRSVRIRQGDVLVIHPGVTHAYDHTEDLELFNIVYDNRKLVLPLLDGNELPLIRLLFPMADEAPRLDSMATPITHLELKELAEVLKMAHSLQNQLKIQRPGALFYAFIGFLDAVAQIARSHTPAELEKNPSPFLIGEAIDYMARHYAEPISLDQLAHAARMSRRSFCRHFRQMVGCSPTERLLAIRLNRAEDLLRHTNAGITEIAVRCGFCDGNYFCRKFKETHHITPRTFRHDGSSENAILTVDSRRTVTQSSGS